MTRLDRRSTLAYSSLAASYGAVAVLIACTSDHPTVNAASADVLATEVAVLTDAPEVPPAITRKKPARVIAHLEVKEVEARLADGVNYTFWTFGGKVPGKFIRVREGDEVELHLDNHPDNKMPHNIDLHAVTGPGGGAPSTLTAPGHSSVFSFKALNPGLYVYHCATAPVPMHVGNGMYGLILVEPKEGLPKVDREFYVMQGEFYTRAPAKGAASQTRTFDTEKAIDEKPDYVVFNGSVGSTTGAQALQAKVGETVRLFAANGGPNLTSSFHVIGEIFDRVWTEGNTSVTARNVQTTTIPPGGATIAEFQVKVPGNFILVDHSLSRAFNKGAIAQLTVTGPEDKLVYSGKIRDEIYAPKGTQPVLASGAATGAAAANKAERIQAGARVFSTNCAACHQANGQGVPNAFPPLAGSDYFKGGSLKLIKTVTGGLQGKVVVNGKEYNGIMPAWSLTDEEIANVLTFITNSWGNAGAEIKPVDVKSHRVTSPQMAGRASGGES